MAAKTSSTNSRVEERTGKKNYTTCDKSLLDKNKGYRATFGRTLGRLTRLHLPCIVLRPALTPPLLGMACLCSPPSRIPPPHCPSVLTWQAYRPGAYYFEVLECFRRLLLTGCLVFILPNSAGQAAVACVLSVLTVGIFALLHPYSDSNDHRSYTLGALAIFLTMFMGLVVRVSYVRGVAGNGSQETGMVCGGRILRVVCMRAILCRPTNPIFWKF